MLLGRKTTANIFDGTAVPLFQCYSSQAGHGDLSNCLALHDYFKNPYTKALSGMGGVLSYIVVGSNDSPIWTDLIINVM